MDTYDVAVVGCGPVGLTLARLLAMKGLRVAAIDTNRLVCYHPRATHLDDETMRLLQTLGAQDMEHRFLRQTAWTLHREDGRAFLQQMLPEEESDQSWRTDYQFHQPDFESRLRGLLAADANVDLRFGWTVSAMEQDDTAVRLTLLDRSTGAETTLTAGYAVGSDGANSFVRQAMNAEVEDLHGTQRSLIIDTHPFEHPAQFPADSGFILCRGQRPVTYLPIFPPMLRFEFMLLDEDDAAELERPQSVYDLLSRWLEPGSYRIMRTDTYQWHARLVRGWRSDRLLLAGDAAHQMPPMLGQGMCSGLRDAVNLAWKLAAVVKGESPSALLDTYESERAPHVRPYIEQPRGARGERLDDTSGYGFTVVGNPGVTSAVSAEVRQMWHRLDAVVVPETGPAADRWLAAYSAAAAIIRPDRYTFALATDTAELEQATRDLARMVSIQEAGA
ncbi:FAD-dependent monooxygenase [Streptomyces sp. 5-6(2022)]|uniref:FAD-dependent monooxygenase n=1 Tax=Streptomyces sp. 5-6(2022) TaxID=2936510 RepID=UPI0023B8B8C7|nr:FAD-dependent monooxygenase [Streptomyces sp. 5-6(2022)]